jgi:hypothetical protein
MPFQNPIDDMKAIVGNQGGFARTNFFAVTFNGPASIGKPDPVIVNALCESAQLPGRSISTFEHGMTGQTIKRPYGYINDDVTLTFYVTNDFYIKKLWEQWLNSVINDVNKKVGYRDNYAQDITISVLNLNHNEIHQVTLTKAYPITVNAIDLNNGSENELMKLSVTLTYEDYTTKSNNFETISSIPEFNSALTIPAGGITSMPFSPFGDISNQLNFTSLDDLKGALQGSLNGALDSIVNNIQGGIRETITSVTRPITSAINSVTNSITGGFNQVVGTLTGGINGVINNVTGSVTSAIGGLINQPISQITGAITSPINNVSNRISSGIRGLFG